MSDDDYDPLLEYMTVPGLRPRPTRRSAGLLAIVIGVGAVLLLMSLMPVASPDARHAAQRVKCMANLRQIGQHLLIYSNDTGGFPDSLMRIVNDDTTLTILQCPDRPAPMTLYDLQIHPEWLSDPNHVGYTYIPPTTEPTGADVLAFEIVDHDDTGGHVLMGDGRVLGLPPPELRRLRADFATGVRPLRVFRTSARSGSH